MFDPVGSDMAAHPKRNTAAGDARLHPLARPSTSGEWALAQRGGMVDGATVTRSSRFLSGFSFGLANQVLTLVVGLFLTPFLLRYLGQSDLGMWLVASSLMGYLGLLDLGVAALLPRETAYAAGRNPERPLPAVSEVFGQALQIALLQLPLVAVGALMLLPLLPESGEKLLYPFLMVLGTFVLLFPLRLFQAVLSGLQDLRFLGILQTVSWAAGTIASISLVLANAGLFAVAAGWMVTQVLSALACLWRLRTAYPDALPRKLPKLSMEGIRSWLSRSLWITVSNVAQLLRLGTDVVIIGKLLGPEAVVPFTCTAKLVSVLSNAPQLVLASAQPALAELRMSSNKERITEVASALERLTLFVSGAVFCGVLSINEGFVLEWVGTEQYGGLGLTLLFLASMLLRHFCLSVNTCLFCFGHERRLALTAVTDGVVTLVAMWTGVYLAGWQGAALAPIIGICTVSLPMNLSLFAKDTGRTVGQVLRNLLPWAIRCAAVAALALGITMGLAPRGFPLLTLAGAVVGGVYLLVMGPLLFQGTLGTYVRPRVEALRARFVSARGGGRLGTG
ncbi:oligosaccharide flippase family protein [Archangium minus]|uniref:Oligosaccharide flippase family protein n=2 Tax=Archangium minus TaxID=83450 RepID=A0ABY9WKD8_9BACT|nr:oligosaccharide flippase family protein [Archangium minus]